MAIIVPTRQIEFTIPMNADHIPDDQHIWDGSPDTWGSRHPGSFQLIWSGADATDAVVSWEISNDGINWVTWTGSWSNDNSAVTYFPLDTASGSQIFEVLAWVSAYYRINFDHGTNTTGQLTYRIHRTK